MTNSITDLANSVGTGAITEAWTIMNWPIGYIIIFFIALAVLSSVVAVVKRFTGGGSSN